MEEKGGQEKFRHVESFRPRELARRVIPSIDDSPAQECTARTGALATAERTRVQSTRRGRREGLSNRAKETVDGIDFSPAKLGHSFERCRSRSHCTRCNVAGMVVSLEELATFITANTRSPRTAAFYSPAGGSIRGASEAVRAATRRNAPRMPDIFRFRLRRQNTGMRLLRGSYRVTKYDNFLCNFRTAAGITVSPTVQPRQETFARVLIRIYVFSSQNHVLSLLEGVNGCADAWRNTRGKAFSATFRNNNFV